jgi:hypothetical protein
MNNENHPLYTTWRKMRERCNNPNHKFFHHYGGRGIKVCPEWDNFWVFVSDMGERPVGHSLDRIDNNKGYSKNNCRWATRSEQRKNSKTPFKLHAKGIEKLKNGGYRARISCGKKIHTIGQWECPLLAHLAYKDVASILQPRRQ